MQVTSASATTRVTGYRVISRSEENPTYSRAIAEPDGQTDGTDGYKEAQKRLRPIICFRSLRDQRNTFGRQNDVSGRGQGGRRKSLHCYGIECRARELPLPVPAGYNLSVVRTIFQLLIRVWKPHYGIAKNENKEKLLQTTHDALRRRFSRSRFRGRVKIGARVRGLLPEIHSGHGLWELGVLLEFSELLMLLLCLKKFFRVDRKAQRANC